MSNVLDFTEKQTILVVDDAPDNLALMRGLLSPYYRVKVANRGEKALLIAAGEEPPDLILLDIMMPGMDGHAVCKALKSNPASYEIPVIFLTAKATAQDEQIGFDLGAVDYITKPVNPPVLLARVKAHIAQKMMYDFLRDKGSFLESQLRKADPSANAGRAERAALAELSLRADD